MKMRQICRLKISGTSHLVMWRNTPEVLRSVYRPGARVRKARPTLGTLMKLDNPFLFLMFVGVASPANRRK